MWKQPKCHEPSEWIKVWYKYAMEYNSAIKRMNFAICSNMDRLGEHYAELNKSDKDKYGMISLTYGNWKTQQTREYNKKERLTDIEDKLVVTSG